MTDHTAREACECLCHDVLPDPCAGCQPGAMCVNAGYPDPPVDPALATECEGCS